MSVEGFDVKKPFGTSVRAWRSRLGISQEELAGRAGLHRTYICDVERGARNVTLQSIERLALALEVSVSTLLAYPRRPLPDGARPEEFPPEEMVDILYVEDNAADVELATEGLKHVTNRIQVVRDGQAALNFLFSMGEYAHRRGRSRPNLILLDLGLPKVDGLDVLRRVKTDPRTAAIPVIVLTASLRGRDLEASKRLGADGYLIKPVDLKNLAHVTPQLKLHWALLKPAIPPAAATEGRRAPGP
jgi:CheY-like chemotaxis protein/DNA-binding XRE family transcriptional regulator